MSLNQILRNDANPVGIYDVRLKTVECKTLLAEALTIVNLNVTNLTATGSIVGHSGEFVARVGAGIGRQVGNAEIFAITEDKDPTVPAFLNLRKIGDDENQYKVEVKNLSTTITAIRSITETVTGNKTEAITGNKTETITGNKTVNAANLFFNTHASFNLGSPIIITTNATSSRTNANTYSITMTTSFSYVQFLVGQDATDDWKVGTSITVNITHPDRDVYGRVTVINPQVQNFSTGVALTVVQTSLVRALTSTTTRVQFWNLGNGIGPSAANTTAIIFYIAQSPYH